MTATAAAPAAAPGTGPRYDAHAAKQGLLIDEAEARGLAAGGSVLEPAVDAAPWGDVEVTLNFSTALPLPVPEKEKAPARREAAAPPIAPPAAASIPPAWIVPAAALIAFLAVGGGTAWLLLPGATLAAALSSIAAPFRDGSREAPAPSPPIAEPAPARQAAPVEQTDPRPSRRVRETATRASARR